MRGIRKFIAQATIALVAMFVVSIVFVTRANAATFIVTNTNDSGAGSLREAISDANANGNPSVMDVIEFSIPGSGVKTIAVTTALPALTQKVTINGYSQPGASANTVIAPNPLNGTILIEIDGESINGDGAGAGEASGLSLSAADCVIKGLSIYNFGGVTANEAANGAITVLGADAIIQGNYLGVRADGMTRGTGRNDTAVGLIASGGLIGGTNLEDRNVIFAKSNSNTTAAVFSVGSGAEIYGNYIGIAKDGVTDLTPEEADTNGLNPPFSFGINMTNGGGVKIGGPSAGKRNVISGNTAGVIFSSNNNVVQGNYIGTDYTGNVNEGITNGAGVINSVGEQNQLGGVNPGEGNYLKGLKGFGVSVNEFSLPTIPYEISGQRLSILGNSIFDIEVFSLNVFGNSNLAIDLARQIDTSDPADFLPDAFEQYGPDENDAGDGDSGANGKINSPEINSAQQVSNQLTVNYSLDAADSPSNSYRVEFYANDASTIFGTGPGEEYLGAITVSPGTNLTASFTVSGDYGDKALSATTTAIDTTSSTGFGATSEFAQNVEIGSATDADADGIADLVEDGAPNGGDGNNDGIADKLQPTVSSFVDVNGDHYITFSVSGCRENSNVAVLEFAALNARDNGYQYPFGLTDFTLNCSRGDTASITMYTFSEEGVNGFKPRKFRSATNSFATIDGAVLAEEEIGGEKAIKLTYSITDGSALDDDGQENGLIVDPVGLANPTLIATILPETGIPYWFLPVPLALLFTAVYVIYDWRRHRKPLVDQDPSVHYTIWHHLRVVTIPLFKYRISFVVSKPSSTSGQTPNQ